MAPLSHHMTELTFITLSQLTLQRYTRVPTERTAENHTEEVVFYRVYYVTATRTTQFSQYNSSAFKSYERLRTLCTSPPSASHSHTRCITVNMLPCFTARPLMLLLPIMHAAAAGGHGMQAPLHREQPYTITERVSTASGGDRRAINVSHGQA